MRIHSCGVYFRADADRAKWVENLGRVAEDVLEFLRQTGNPLGNPAADIRGVCNADNTIKGTHDGGNRDFEVIPASVFTTNAPLGLQDELAAAIDRFTTNKGPNAVRFDILGSGMTVTARRSGVEQALSIDDLDALAVRILRAVVDEFRVDDDGAFIVVKNALARDGD